MNKYAHLADPQAELDFHGQGILTPAQIRTMLDDFIAKSRSAGHSKLLIITGKGMHSRGGQAVVRPTVQAHLATHPAVTSFTKARRDRGGEGAFEVQLTQQQVQFDQ